MPIDICIMHKIQEVLQIANGFKNIYKYWTVPYVGVMEEDSIFYKVVVNKNL